MSKPTNYSSQSYSPGSSKPAKSSPTDCKLDKSGKTKEKDDMVGLNDKFVQLIEKVKSLEAENRKLVTKLEILKEQEDYEGNVDNIVRHFKNDLEQKIENLQHDQEKLQAELFQNQEEVEDIKNRYADELQKKDDLEKEFILAKKEADDGHMQEIELTLKLEDLTGKMDFLRAGYDEEIEELESQIQDMTVIIPNNNKRSLDMDDIIDQVKNQYINMAARAREEAEQWHQKKMDDMVVKADKHEQDVRDMKRAMSDIVRHIFRLKGDLEALKRKEQSLKKEINDIRTEGDGNVEKAQQNIGQVEDALRQARKDLAEQLRDYQELMDLKLALDIEIATYRKLLEGEEARFNSFMRRADVHLPDKPAAPEHTIVPPATVIPATTVFPAEAIIPPEYPSSKKRLLIRVEVKAGRVVSESVRYSED